MSRLRWIDRLLDPAAQIAQILQDDVVQPAWRRVTDGESVIPVVIGVGIAIVLQATLAPRIADPRWLFVGLSSVLLVALVVAAPLRLDRRSRPLRALMLLLIASMSIANIIAGARLVIDLANGRGIRS